MRTPPFRLIRRFLRRVTLRPMRLEWPMRTRVSVAGYNRKWVVAAALFARSLAIRCPRSANCARASAMHAVSRRNNSFSNIRSLSLVIDHPPYLGGHRRPHPILLCTQHGHLVV